MSHTKLTYHGVWSTKHRVAALYDNMRKRLHSYIAEIINEEFGFALEVGGVDDHVHVVCDIRPSYKVSDVMRQLKSKSSGWIHRELPNLRDVSWQTGYGAFTVSASAVPDVVRYIRNQEKHHKSMGFKEEFIALLEKHGIEYEEKYVFAQ
ncbi:MAG: IS200/IS605 family transposase [Planctomycetes bacterium]|nr:IS200/IS605 family transposase [Planctomycetota bacterium]